MKRLFSATLLLTSLGFASAAAVMMHGSYLGSRSNSWPHTMGTVESSELVWSTDAEGLWNSRESVVYRYSVQGSKHRGTKIGFGVVHTKDEAAALQYPRGSKVAVYYDPDKPDRSCLERGGGGLADLGAAVFCLLVSVLSFLGWLEAKGIEAVR